MQCVAAAAALASLLPPLSRSVSVTCRFIRTSPIEFSDLNLQGDFEGFAGDFYFVTVFVAATMAVLLGSCLMARASLGFLPLLCLVSASRRVLIAVLAFAGVSRALLVRRDRCRAINFSASVGSYFTNASSAGLSVLVWILRELVRRISGESNVWSGLQRMWWPDQDFVNPASPVLLSDSPSGRSAAPRTVLRLLTPMISSLGAGSDTKLKLGSPETSKLF
ncbi:hypothetical protein Bca4012_013093 [Brassica carinata]